MTRYSLEVYHMMGTRVLSRSFTLTEEDMDDSDEGEPQGRAEKGLEAHAHDIMAIEDVGNTSLGSAMDVDEPSHGDELQTNHDHEDEQEERGGSSSDDEDAPEVAMVPMADILNARYQTENVSIYCLQGIP